MIEILPQWYSEEREKLERYIYDIAARNNINFRFVVDSFLLRISIDNIMDVLKRIKTETVPDIPERDFRELMELEKKETS